MARYRDEWSDDDLDAGSEYELTAEERAALAAALGGNGGVDTGTPYGPPVPAVNDPSDVLQEMVRRYNEIDGDLTRIRGQLAATTDIFTRDTLGKQYTALQKQQQSLASTIDTMRQRRQTADRLAQGSEDSFLTPSTTAPYLLRRRPDGTIEEIPNPNYRPPATSAAESAALQRLYWDQQNYPEELAYEREQERQKAEFERQKHEDTKSNWWRTYENQRDQIASNTGDWMMRSQIQAMPYAVDPSWTSYPGFEAGGPVERLYRMGGSTSYTPPVIPRTTFDPIAAWRAGQRESKPRQE